MTARVTIVDYGTGNLLSVRRGFESFGSRVEITDSPASIDCAERLVLPGVGAFQDGMAGLEERGLVAPLRGFAATGRPFLGICLGMQLMFDESEEHGTTPGLGLLRGRVAAIPSHKAGQGKRKIPHIGWATLMAPWPQAWESTVLQGTAPGTYSVYFVHSFHALPAAPAELVAVTDYAGCSITAAVRRANLHGCQFHPEKSGPRGLKVLENFLRLPA